MPSAETTLPCTTASVPSARRFVESALLGWDLDAVAWDAAMITSELATNAALHAGGASFTVVLLAREDRTVRLEVRDDSPRVPQQRSHSATSTTGRGLRIVDDLATRWGVEPRDGGKTVWVELAAVPTGDQASDDDEEVDLDALLAVLGEDEAPRARAA